ncbi:MAG: peptidoglycan editing factor PgeF [Anaerolineae bacterium]|nr:peptidoglycan editing factor PgeF [Anaerolineae bacterium]MBL8106935.1 peptidoglycan editing factor PgeF [Anaerolineales bacterium]MCC7188036.1 peptidoglycan editing factor PgeF [Anaerolineales bacterium]
MPFAEMNGLRYYQFESLNTRHAVFTRHGGASPKPWGSLNVGGTVGDDLDRVRKNRQLSFRALDRAPESIFDVWQVHSADVVCAKAPRPEGESVRQADVILTDKPEVSLFMRFADCVPILAHDPRKGVVGVAHAGWMGTLRGVAGSLVNAMKTNYNSNPADIVACIGPSIGPDHYEIGADVILQVMQKFGDDSEMVLRSVNGKIHFDLWKTNRILLEQAGVQHIEVAGICTACHTDDWFSHRAEKGRTGRFGALIAL